VVSVCGLRLYKEDCGLWRLCMRQRDRVMCKQEKLGRRARSEARAGLHLCHNGCAWGSSNVYELRYECCRAGLGGVQRRRWAMSDWARQQSSTQPQPAQPAGRPGKQLWQAASSCICVPTMKSKSSLQVG
jgi:hypothetical protein